jgi:hypothetical protein
MPLKQHRAATIAYGKGYEERSSQHFDDKYGLYDDMRKAEMEEARKKDADYSVETESLHFDIGQVKELAKADVNFLAGMALPSVFEHIFPPVLLAIWSLLLQQLTVLHSSPQVAVGIPRGHGKTTIVKLYILYCILFTRVRFILVICSTEQHAVNILADVEDMLNEFNIIQAFGDWKQGVETNTLSLKKFGFMGRNIILAAIGAGGAVRGINLKNERPDLMIFEDIQTKECAESEVQSGALERWMIGTAMKARSPRGCMFLFVGNMYPGGNSILRKLRDNSNWIKFVSGAILADGSSLWPALRSIDSLIAEFNNDISMGHPEIFLSEVMNDTEVGINSNTDLSLIKSWPWQEHDVPQGKFIIVDPSTNKKQGDDVALGLFEVYDGIPGLRKVTVERLSPGNTIRRALLMALEAHCKLIVVESTAFQYTLLYWFEQISEQLGITGISFVPVYTGNYSKNSRISSMLKALTQAEMYIHDTTRSIVTNEIKNWNPMKRDNTDNILDLLSYAPRAIELYAVEMTSDIEAFIVNSEVGEGVEEYNSAF